MKTPQRGSRYSRWRAASLTAVYALMGIHIAHWKLAGRTLAPLEYNEVLHTVHLGIVTAGFVFMAIAIVATSVVGRFFCSWGCHILALEDLSAWLLARVGIHPKAIRSRVLVWVPLLTMAYLFVWPQIVRMWRGQGLPALRVVSGSEGWSSFVTSDMWRNLPGPWITVLTFAVCGLAIVYFLGSRSFCSYVCPYGAIFAAADRLAPGRIVAIGDCQQCGRCTAACQSHVRVHEEVARFGAVMSSSCLKDLDCVGVCPNQVLRFAFTRPALFRPSLGPSGHRHRYSFSRLEDVLMATTFAMSFLVFRGLYDAVPLLLALAIAAIAAYVAVLGLRLVRDRRVYLNRLSLKVTGRLTVSGVAFAGAALVLGGLIVHSAFIRYHTALGERALAEVARLRDEPVRGPALAGAAAAASTALAHLETTYQWGLVRPPSLRRRLAPLYAMTNAPAAAEAQLRALVMAAPRDREARLDLAQLLLQQGQLEAAARELAELTVGGFDLDSSRDREIRGAAHRALAEVAERTGRRAEAIEHRERAAHDDPRDVQNLVALGALLADAGRLADAETYLLEGARLQPSSATLHNNLGVVLAGLGRVTEAMEHYETSLRIKPDDARAYVNLGMLLYGDGQREVAANAFETALRYQPVDAGAHYGLALIFGDRGDSERARWHRQRALELDGRRHRPAGTLLTPPSLADRLTDETATESTW